MGVFVFLPLVLPLSAVPVARRIEGHLHPRGAARLLTAVAVVLAGCSTLCLALLFVVGTAQVPGNPLPDGWSDPQVRAAVPHVQTAGSIAIFALTAVCACAVTVLWRHRRARRRALTAVQVLPSGSELAVLTDSRPFAYALPGPPDDRIVVSTAMLACLDSDERRVLFAHERAHLTGRHHRYLLATRLAATAHPLLRSLHTATAYSLERWADEDAAGAVGDRRAAACAVGKAALAGHGSHPTAGSTGPVGFTGLAGFAAAGPVPRRVAALLGPAPPARWWPAPLTPAGGAALLAAAGVTASVLSAVNAAVALFLVLKAATPW